MEVDQTPPQESEGYPGAAVGGAVLATLFFPFIALIAALLLQGGQTNPRKKSQLRTWAWGSGVWLLSGLLLFLLAIGTFGHSNSASSSKGFCVGGPKIGATGTQVPGSTTKFVEPCAISGSQTITISP